MLGLEAGKAPPWRGLMLGSLIRSMSFKTSLKQSLFIVGILGIVFFSMVIVFLIRGAKSASSVSSAIPQGLVAGQSVSAGLPVRLKIPKINVDAAVESVGLTADGAMDVPKGPADVAWFERGTRPGEQGSAVIAGHVDWKDGSQAVFSDLHNLKPGDKVVVQDNQGATSAFVVVASQSYDSKANASDVFGSNDGKAHLNLITCAGVWDKTQESYSKRLVVFTDKEIE